MWGVTAPATLAPAVPAQTEFAELMGVLGVKEVGALPEGISALSAKEALFVARLVSHGKIAEAAREAGYKGENVGITGSRLLRRPDIQRFYAKCLNYLARNADEVVRRVYERSVAAHAAAMQAWQVMHEVDDFVELARKEREGSQAAKHVEINERDMQRKRELAARDFLRFTAAADKSDALLASMMGKLNVNVNVSGSVIHVTKNVCEAFANMRQTAVQAGLTGRGGN